MMTIIEINTKIEIHGWYQNSWCPEDYRKCKECGSNCGGVGNFSTINEPECVKGTFCSEKCAKKHIEKVFSIKPDGDEN